MLHTKEVMKKIDLVPFSQAIKQNISCIMTSHLMVLSYDSVPCTFSKEMVQHLLREKMQFSGLIITDALNMKALRNYFSMEEIGLKALLAGHDILLYGDHIGPNVDEILQEEVPVAYKRILQGVQRGEISLESLDAHVRRILEAKDNLGILQKKPTIDSDLSSLSSKEASDLKKKLFHRAMTSLGKTSITSLAKDKKVVYVEVGNPVDTTFRNLLCNKYSITPSSLGSLKEKTKNRVVVVGLYSINPREKNFGIDPSVIEDIKRLVGESLVIGVLFGSPYAIETLSFLSSILIAYEEEKEAQKEAFDVIIGKNKAEGVLPVEIKYPRK
jgi:beta-glucosidase-like glycosyl hydrolase